MSLEERNANLGMGSFQPKDRVSTVMTSWGYVVRTRDKHARRATLIERVCLIAGIALIIPGAWHWALPGVGNAFETTGQQLTTVVSILVAGLLFFWISVRGLREEVHVDRLNREIRVMAVNRNGATRAKNVVRFENIQSAFIKRDGEHGHGKLFLRMKKGEPIGIASGDLAALEALTQRMTQDVGRKEVTADGWQRVGRRLVRADA